MTSYLYRIPRPSLMVAVLLSLALVGCGDKESASEARTSPGASQEQTAQTTDSSPPLPAQGSAPPPAPAPVVEYTPNEHEVRQAFRHILLQSYHKRPADERRDLWFIEENNRILGIQVGNCSKAPLGMVSECFVSISGQAMKIQLLLTQSGWVIIG